ncbi:MAG: sulfatase-like hydrolase/transferase, partial [bacterium]|nr:sulfatase-like hydrolase/transferase [bacterium]
MKPSATLSATLLLAACTAPETATPPNVVLLVADDMGYADLSSFGSPDIRTPHIDSIGARGVKLTQHYTNGPSCTPTRTALMTGRYQQRVGGLECAIGVGNVGRYDEAVWLADRGELGLPASEPTLPRLLKDHGYDTACSGKWHLGYMAEHSPNRHGFDEYFGILGGNADYFRHVEAAGDKVLYHNSEPVDRDGYLTELFVDHAVEWLSRRSEKPFFLYVPFNAPHTPVQGPDDSDKEITAENWGQGDRATYARMVEAMDTGVGRILAQLDE